MPNDRKRKKVAKGFEALMFGLKVRLGKRLVCQGPQVWTPDRRRLTQTRIPTSLSLVWTSVNDQQSDPPPPAASAQKTATRNNSKSQQRTKNTLQSADNGD